MCRGQKISRASTAGFAVVDAVAAAAAVDAAYVDYAERAALP